MRKKLFALIGLIALGALGAGAMLFDSARAAAEESEAKEQNAFAGPKFVRLDNLMIPVIRHSQVERHVTLSIALEVENAEDRRKVQTALPRLRDAFIADLNGYLRVVRSENNPRYLLILKKRLMKVGARVVGDGVIDAVLVQQASERDLL